MPGVKSLRFARSANDRVFFSFMGLSFLKPGEKTTIGAIVFANHDPELGDDVDKYRARELPKKGRRVSR